MDKVEPLISKFDIRGFFHNVKEIYGILNYYFIENSKLLYLCNRYIL